MSRGFKGLLTQFPRPFSTKTTYRSAHSLSPRRHRDDHYLHRWPRQRQPQPLTRSSANWIGRPGSFDPLHCSRLLPSASPFGIPDLLPQAFEIPEDFRLLPYRSRLDQLDPSSDICHFYLDDYRFEATWNRIEPGW